MLTIQLHPARHTHQASVVFALSQLHTYTGAALLSIGAIPQSLSTIRTPRVDGDCTAT